MGIVANAAKWHVGPGQTYATVQAAVDTASSGDVIIIHAGTYREEVNIDVDGLTIQPNGSDEVIMNGCEPLLSWTSEGSGVYSTTMDWDIDESIQSNQIFVDGVMMHEARWPKQPINDNIVMNPTQGELDGYKWVADRNTDLYDSDITSESDARWEGAKIYINLSNQFNQKDGQGWTGHVHSKSGNTINVRSNDDGVKGLGHFGNNNWGVDEGTWYYLFSPTPAAVAASGGVTALLGEGEWWKDGNTLYVKLPGNSTPSSSVSGTNLVEAKKYPFAFRPVGETGVLNNVTIKNLTLFATAITTDNDYDYYRNDLTKSPTGTGGKTNHSAQNVVIDGIKVKYIYHTDDAYGDFQNMYNGRTGLVLAGFDCEIKNSEFQYSAASVISVSGARNKVLNNLIYDANYMVGECGALNQGGKRWLTEDHNIGYNTIYNTTHAAISIRNVENSNENTPGVARVHHNYIYDATMRVWDAGYIDEAGEYGNWLRIDHNILVGNNDMHGEDNSVKYGIYIDFGDGDFGRAAKYIIDHNVSHNFVFPIGLNNCNNYICVNNTAYIRDNWRDFVGVNRYEDGVTVGENAIMVNNIGKIDGALSPETESNNNDITGGKKDTYFTDYLNADYTLTSDASNLIDKGIPTDWDDTISGSAPDIGAFEYGVTPWTAGYDPDGFDYDYTLTIVNDNNKGTVTQSSTNGQYGDGDIAGIEADPEVGYEFTSWSGDVPADKQSDNPLALTMDANKSITAAYSSVTTYTLTVSDNGNGSVDVSPNDDNFEYNTGTSVELSPDADVLYNFEKWTGDVATANETDNPLTITMDADKSITANFVEVEVGGAVYAVASGLSGSETYTDASGRVFTSGEDYVIDGTSTYTVSDAISGTEEDFLFQSERYKSDLSYDFAVPDGNYKVEFGFSELYFTSNGNRVFDVNVEGSLVIDDLDIHKEVGHDAAYVVTTQSITVGDGNLDIDFIKGTDNPKIAYIAVLLDAEPTVVADPVISPNGGGFFGSQSVEISTNTPDADIYYTTDGSTPSSSNGTLYSGAFSITETTTIKAIGLRSDLDNSNVVSATFTEEVPVSITQTSTAVTIDGTIESVWSNAVSYNCENVPNGASEITDDNDLSGSFRMLWDANNLYILAEVTDDIIKDDSDSPWQDDGIEIFIDIGNDKADSYGDDDYQYGFEAGGSNFTEYKHDSTTGVSYSAASVTGGYVIEAQIPWSTLGETAAVDVLMGFDINLVDDDTGGDSFDSKKSYYNENPTSHNDPSTLGFAQLAGDDGTTYFTLTTSATNGDITLDPSGGTYAENATVSASASADEGYEFSDWDGAYDGTNNPVDIIMDGNKSLTANFSPIAVTGVSIDQTGPVSVTEGSTTTLSATVSPGDALDQSISWSSGDEAIATVNSSGTVTGVAVGSATITVTTNDGGYTDNITVDVTEVPDVPVTGVSIDQTGPIALTEGNTTTLSATVSPSDATDQGVSWSSSDDAVATVTSNGTVTAEAEGSATITVTTNDGGFTDNITIDVSAPVPSDDVIPWLENFTGLPDGTTSESETSSDWSLNGTTNGGGNYLFEVSSEQLEARHLTEEVSFQSAAIDISSATAVEISLDLTQGGGMEGDDYVKLYYKVDGGSEVLADEVSDDLSSSPYQLSVSNIAGSTLEVIIKMNNNGWGESWIVDNISVQSTSSTPVTGVSIDQSGPIALTEGNTTTLSATVSPSDATDQSVSWASSDDAIATVDANGVVTGEADGTATITVTTNDGGYTDDITVNVAAPGTDNEIPWLEDFSGLSDGTTSESGTSSDWSLTGTANGGGNYLFEVSSEQLIAQNLQEEVSFNSATIDISSATSVDISLDITQNGGMEGDDYVKLYYKVDGGSETLADEVSDDLPNSPYQLSATGISGNTLEVIVKMLNVNGWSEAWKIDNISVTDPKSAEAELSMGSASSVKLYPNPTSSNAGLTIELMGFENETEATISIMDISGRIAYSTNVQTTDRSVVEHTLNIANLSSGMYMVVVRSNNKVINQRLIIK